MRVLAKDGYPLHATPAEASAYFLAGRGLVSWVAVSDAGEIVGHVALRHDPQDYVVVSATRALGVAADRVAVVSRLFASPQLRRSGVGRLLLRHAAGHAASQGMRAVLDVGQSLSAAVALYEAEGWCRIDELQVPIKPGLAVDVWVYAAPEHSES